MPEQGRLWGLFLDNAKEQIAQEVGPELGELNLEDLNPRNYDPRKIVRDALGEDLDAIRRDLSTPFRSAASTAVRINDALREIGELNRVLAEIENRMNDDIAAIKSAAAEDAATYRSRLEALENGVYAFAELKKNDLFDDKRRSVKLDFGIIGYRRSHEIGTSKGFTWKAVYQR